MLDSAELKVVSLGVQCSHWLQAGQIKKKYQLKDLEEKVFVVLMFRDLCGNILPIRVFDHSCFSDGLVIETVGWVRV